MGIRHGQSEANKGGLIQGQKNSALSEDGKKQAELAGLALSGVAFDKIYASDLERAYETAIIISQKNQVSSNIASDKNSNIVEANELLRERCFGIFDLRPHKEFLEAAKQSGFEYPYDFIPEGGEGLLDVKKRASKFLEFVFESTNNNSVHSTKTCNILIVSHSGFLRQIGIYFLHDCKCTFPEGFEFPDGYNFENVLEKAWKNTAISRFEVEVDERRTPISVECTQYANFKHLENVSINNCDN